MSVFFSYGLLSLIYLATNPEFNYELLNTMTVHTFVYAEVLIFLSLLHIFPSRDSKWLYVDEVMERLASVSDTVVLGIMSLVVLFVGYLAFRYKALSYFILTADRSSIEPIPYYVSSFSMHLVSVMVGIFLVMIAKVIVKKEKNTILNWSVVLGWTALLFFYGRRNLFYPIFFSLVFYFRYHKSSLFSKKALPTILGIGLTLVMLSNLYQAVRIALPQRFTLSVDEVTDPEVSSAFDFNSSLENVRTRTPNYLVDERLLKNMDGSIWGLAEFAEITVAEIMNSIPNIFWPDKRYISTDEILNIHGKNKSEDIPSSIFNQFLADYGYFSLLAVPLVLFLFWTSSLKLLSKLSSNSFVFIIAFSLFFQAAFQIEGGLGCMLISLRETLLILVLFKLYNLLSGARRVVIVKG